MIARVTEAGVAATVEEVVGVLQAVLVVATVALVVALADGLVSSYGTTHMIAPAAISNIHCTRTSASKLDTSNVMFNSGFIHVPSFFCLFFGGFLLPFFCPVATFSVGIFCFLPANRKHKERKITSW